MFVHLPADFKKTDAHAGLCHAAQNHDRAYEIEEACGDKDTEKVRCHLTVSTFTRTRPALFTADGNLLTIEFNDLARPDLAAFAQLNHAID